MNISKKLECPFTWGIDDVLISQYDKKQKLEVSVDSQAVVAFMMSVTSTYINIEQENYAETENDVAKTEEIWTDLNTFKHDQIKKDKISLDVLLHIKEATKLCAFEKINHPQAKKVLNNIVNLKNFKNKLEIATIEGCKSIAWLIFHQYGFERAMEHAKLAYANNPDCSLWNFVLAKTLRYSRRTDNFSNDITNDEKNHFIRSYQLLPIPYYGIYVAEMYRDLQEFDKAKKLYEKIYNDQTSDAGILLRLTKHFISIQDFVRAKICLDSLQNLIPEDSAFLHYKALYLEKQGKNKEAVKFLKKALSRDNKNYMAERTYVRCMIKTQKRKFKYLEYLKKMEEKYDGSIRQQVLLDIALYYYFRGRNIGNATVYFWKSIKINPEKKFYRNYYNYHTKEFFNVFDFIKNELIQQNQAPKSLCDKGESIDVRRIKDLMDFCRKNEESL